MNIIDRIFPRLRKRASMLTPVWTSSFEGITAYPFARLIFRNIVELLSDILNDVELINKGSDVMQFAEFKRFVEAEGAAAIYRVFRYGFAVIGITNSGTIRLLRREEWYEHTTPAGTEIKPKRPDIEVYVMRSDTFAEEGVSDHHLCLPFLDFLDNTLNASNTAVARLGAFIVASPENVSGAPAPFKLSDDEKKDIEKNMAQEYGGLARQRQVLLLPRSMKFDVVSLTNIDNRTVERVKIAVAAICDRIKVPANQVAIIDANSSKTLSNGTELREGDFNKYQSFERLFDHTFMRMADELGLRVDYTIYNKPLRQQTQQPTQ